MQFCVMPRTLYDSSHSCTQHNAMTKKVNIAKFFSRVLVIGNSMRIDMRQSIQLCSPHTGDIISKTADEDYLAAAEFYSAGVY